MSFTEKKECIPKLYYSNKFPDIYELEMENGNNVVDFVKELRESYAIKAMLIFSHSEKRKISYRVMNVCGILLCNKKKD
jgi:hypothetical protein